MPSLSYRTQWPFKQAELLTARWERLGKRGTVLFQTGFGPSGLPHIGTFAEIVRTNMVRRAFAHLNPDCRTHLVCFSDDMDGLRKVPENVPQPAMLEAHLGQPLCKIPNPFASDAPSFAAHNNARLAEFLDQFGFDAELRLASDYYQSGKFDAVLRKVLARHDEIAAIIRQGMGDERARRFSPFLPICPQSGKVLLAEITETNAQAGWISYLHPDTGEEIKQQPITGGRCKLQWKADWAMRWAAFGVDYEMAGKDLRDSISKSGAVVKLLDGVPPVSLCYELFLDAQGRKISKSLGNGVSLEQWLSYAPAASLSHLLFRAPQRAQRLSLHHIPRDVDDWLSAVEDWQQQDEAGRRGNPLWYQGGAESDEPVAVKFTPLVNLAAASQAPDKESLWGFLRHYAPDVSRQTHPRLDALAGHALAFCRDAVAPFLAPRLPDERERAALEALAARLTALDDNADAAEAQQAAYDVGKEHGYGEAMRDWFKALYQILLGRDEGARFGSFAVLYGRDNMVARIRQACEKAESVS